MSQDFRGFLQQMQGCAVSVVTWDHARLLGTLAAVTDDCIRMTGVVLQDSHETGGWSDRLLIEDLLEDRGNQWPEIIIQRNLISTVTMVSDATRAVSIPPAVIDETQDEAAKHLSDLDASPRPDVRHVDGAVCSVDLQLGRTFAPTIDAVERQNSITERVQLTRLGLEKALGFQLEPFAVSLNTEIPDDQFRLRIHGAEVGRGTIIAGKLLALFSANNLTPCDGLDGVVTVDPVYGLPAIWINPDQRERAIEMGATVVDFISVIATMLDHQVKRHAVEVLTYEAVSAAVEKLRESHPVTVANLVPHPVSLRTLFEVLRGLVAEGVVIRHILPILESVGRHVEHCESIPLLLARVRVDIPLILCGPHIDDSGRIPVIVVDKDVARDVFPEDSEFKSFDLDLLTNFLDEIGKLTPPTYSNRTPVLLVPHSSRTRIWTQCRSRFDDLVVLSPADLPVGVHLEVLGTVSPGSIGRLLPKQEESPETLSEYWQRKPR